MTADVITIGDEILTGQTVDTNAGWIGRQLGAIGMPVRQIVSVSDTKTAIVRALDEALSHSECVLITGGLGPTKDDITKVVLTEYFGDQLVIYPEIEAAIRAHFAAANRPFLEVNRRQALLPQNATIIQNEWGTASGMWFEKGGKHIISMPGVPYEMKALFEKVTPQLQHRFKLADFYHKTVLFQGIPESVMAHKIADIETALREKGIGMAYLPSTGQVKIRLTATLSQKKQIEDFITAICDRFPNAFFGYEEDQLEAVLGKLLTDREATIGTVESCTGGAIAQRIVSIPGSSGYYKGSIVAYSYDLKATLVGVDPETIKKHGAVSRQVVEQMARSGAKKLGVDYCISTSGVAGPEGGTDEKPVGTVWIGVATPDNTYSKQFLFKQNRTRNIESTVVYGLNYARQILLGLL